MINFLSNLLNTQMKIIMKKTLTLVAILATFFGMPNVKAQTVNGILISEIKSDYIEIRAVRRAFSEKIWISLEYGQKILDLNTDTYIKDDRRKEMAFNSALDCVNKMKSYGYELHQVYVVPEKDGGGLKYYIMKRK